VDVAGIVEAVGGSVTRFRAGDSVFGACRGSFAEYATTSESSLSRKPENVSFAEAATVVVAGLTALQGLRDAARVRRGHSVLIHGASGGVGTFAVQIGKWLGASVTGVCSTRNVDMVRSLGADAVIDYTESDFTRGGVRYDVVFDCVGDRSLADCRRVLRPKGTYLMIAGPHGALLPFLGRMLLMPVLSLFSGQRLFLTVSRKSVADLDLLRDLLREGSLKPVIDRTYGLPETAEAVRYLEQGHARGKVVIDVDRAGET
jgi:NADPH:quinone reductase-like Zn-dependent oxidoreductase